MRKPDLFYCPKGQKGGDAYEANDKVCQGLSAIYLAVV